MNLCRCASGTNSTTSSYKPWSPPLRPLRGWVMQRPLLPWPFGQCPSISSAWRAQLWTNCGTRARLPVMASVRRTWQILLLWEVPRGSYGEPVRMRLTNLITSGGPKGASQSVRCLFFAHGCLNTFYIRKYILHIFLLAKVICCSWNWSSQGNLVGSHSWTWLLSTNIKDWAVLWC